jgi:hypothetical protein
MNSEILHMREKTIKKNIENIETQLNKGEICDIHALKDIIDFANNKITESEKELKLINIELTTNNIENNYFNPNECTQKLKELKKRLRKLEKKFNNSNDTTKDNIDQDDETAKSIPYKSFKKLQLATRSTIEMENMTGNILGNLNNQSNQMKGVTNKLGLMNSDIDSSSGILTKMIGRGNRDKKIIILVGLFLCVCIVALLLYKIINKFK